mmetsp:Transcript_1359/g.5845  ORF Transcript_1359/g.5845 Transcript_1359/m.5845 type:complete len:264 (+) Transcript_1359:1402-2193(+)
MVADVPSSVNELPVLSHLLAVCVADLAVLDDAGLPATRCHHSHLLIRIALPHHLVSTVCIPRNAEADELGVRRLHKRIVDTEDMKVFDAPRVQLHDETRVLQGRIEAPVAIRCRRDGCFGFQDDLAIICETRQRPLGEESHVFLREAKELVLLEELLRRAVIQRAGHDEERKARQVFILESLFAKVLEAENPLSHELEERLARRHSDVVHPLWAREPQPCTLSSTENHRGDLSRPDRLETRAFPHLCLLSCRVCQMRHCVKRL